MDRQHRPRVALITGASSGIGWATADRLAREGYLTVLAARRADRLRDLSETIIAGGGRAIGLSTDLGQEGERQSLLDEIRTTAGPIDLLVNNAGFGWYGYASAMPWEIARQMLAINVEAIVHLTLCILPEMLARGYGHIINVGSVAGNLGAQGVALYGGTKAFLSSFTLALSREVRKTGVHVSLVQAGIVTGTEFYAAIEAQPASLRIPAGRFGVTPGRVADRIAALARRPRKVAYVPALIRATTLVEPFLGWALDLAGPLHLRRAASPLDADTGAVPHGADSGMGDS